MRPAILIFFLIGIVEFSRAQSSNFLDSIHKAKDFSEKLRLANTWLDREQDDSIKAEINFELSGIYAKQGNFKNALENAFKALSYFKSLSNQLKTYNSIGTHYADLMQFDKSIEYLNKSASISNKIGDSLGIARANSNLGNAYLKKGKTDSALVLYQKAFDICVRNKIDQGIGIIGNNLAGIYKDRKQYEKAISYYERSLNIATVENNEDEKAFYLNNIGQVYANQKKYSLALEYKNKSLALAQKNNSYHTLVNLYPQLANIYAEMGNYREAFHYDTLNRQVLEQVFKDETAAQVAEMETKYRASEKDIENKLLKETNSRNRSIIHLQQGLFVAIITILLLVSFFAAKWFRDEQKQKQFSLLLKQQKTEIENQNKNLESYNALKDKIFSLISHDLRAPLNTLQALISLYNRKLLTEEESKSYFKEIESRLLTTSSQLDNLLQWSRNQLTGGAIQPKNFDIGKTIVETIELLQPQANLKKIIINNSVHSIFILGDEEMIRIVIRNLLANAIKFSEAGKTIVLESNIDEQVKIIIKDEGIGLSKKEKEQLWSVGNSRKGTANESGTGLGLSLCKEFVERNGGTIGVESNIAAGSSFWFTVPKPTT